MEVDNLTLVLLGVLVALLLYSRFSGASPLVHPLLLGKQSEVSNVRKEGETGVYRSFATGQGTPLTVRPANTLKTVQDVVTRAGGPEGNVPRCILDTSLTDESLREILRLIPLGLRTMFTSLAPSSQPGADSVPEEKPILVLLPPSPSTAMPLLLLSLSAAPSNPLIILPSPLLFASALTSTAHNRPAVVVIWRDLVDDVIEEIFEYCGPETGLLIVGDTDRTKDATVSEAMKKGMSVGWWEEVFERGEDVKEEIEIAEATFGDVHSYFYTKTSGDPIIAKVHHLNITAGMAGLLSLFPADKRPSSALKDVVASSVRLDSPLGMTIAMASIWSGSGFRLIGNPDPSWDADHEHDVQLDTLAKAGQPPPTVLFITSKHHEALLTRLHSAFSSHPLASIAASHTITCLAEGHVGRDGILEKWVWKGIRNDTFGGLAGDKLRAVVIVGDAPLESTLGLSHVLLGLPHSRVHPSPLSTGPVFVTHFHDLQISTPWASIMEEVATGGGARAHVGPPASNIEVLLKGPNVANEPDVTGEMMGSEQPLSGRVWVRGPSVLERVDGQGEVIDGWVDLGEEASVKTNGTFIITSNA